MLNRKTLYSKKILNFSKRKANSVETFGRKEYICKTFTDFFNKNDIRKFNKGTPKGTVSAGRLNWSVRDLLKATVFGKTGTNWIDEIETVTEQWNDMKYSSTKLASIQATFELNEGFSVAEIK